MSRLMQLLFTCFFGINSLFDEINGLTNDKNSPTTVCYGYFSSFLTNGLAENVCTVQRQVSPVPSLVSAEWLYEQITKYRHETRDHLRVVDATWNAGFDGENLYENEHIPSSVFLNMSQCVQSTSHIPRNLPEIDCFSEYLASLGFSTDQHLVVYDRCEDYCGFYSSARVWWLFRLYGHERVSVLNGGLLRWKLLGLPVTTERPAYPRGRFEVKIRKELMRTYDDIVINQQNAMEQLMDARTEDCFAGREPPKNANVPRGHVPGAKNIPLESVIDMKQCLMKSKEELLGVFNAAKIDLSKPVVSMCLTGMTACGVALAADVVGKPNVPVYYGSWTDYGQRAPEHKIKKDN